MRYKSVLEMVWKTSDSLSFKLRFTWIIFIKNIKNWAVGLITKHIPWIL